MPCGTTVRFLLISKSAHGNIPNVFCPGKTILTEGNTALTDLDALAYGRGPGSFTGVRIGIGIAQGLALGADLPMIGVSTLATMARGAWRMTGATRVLAAIDARMGKSTGRSTPVTKTASGTAKRRKRCLNLKPSPGA